MAWLKRFERWFWSRAAVACMNQATKASRLVPPRYKYIRRGKPVLVMLTNNSCEEVELSISLLEPNSSTDASLNSGLINAVHSIAIQPESLARPKLRLVKS